MTSAHALAHVDFTLIGKLSYAPYVITKCMIGSCYTYDKTVGLFRKPGLHVRQLRNKKFSCRRKDVRMCYQQLALTMQYLERIISLFIISYCGFRFTNVYK